MHPKTARDILQMKKWHEEDVFVARSEGFLLGFCLATAIFFFMILIFVYYV